MNILRDVFYTPTELADKLASYIIEEGGTSAIDFCVGDGDLLKAIERRFPNLLFYGTDIAEEAIRPLKKMHPSWQLAVCDFSNTLAFDNLANFSLKKYDLIVLNPPFTCKGSSICKIEFDEVTYHVSTAMQFVANAMKYRTNHGVLYAILPSSCAYSQKDRLLWQYMEKNYNLQVLEEPTRMYWKNCSASIILVSIGEKVNRSQKRRKILFDFSTLPIELIIRGHISPHEAKFVEGKRGVKYVHTTNLLHNRIVNCTRIQIPKHRDEGRYGSVSCRGPAVLIPRVCNPNPEKICVYKKNSIFVPSDCIIVLKTSNVEDAQFVANTILSHWDEFRTIYQGTAAKYTTMEIIKNLFGRV